MNQQNVTALGNALARYIRTYGYIDLGSHDDNAVHCEHLAKFLAGEGVLAPSALLDPELNRVVYGVYESASHQWGVEELERIAKGESV